MAFSALSGHLAVRRSRTETNPDGTILVVEYKGSNLYQSTKIDRNIGELWAELSDGRCRFVMVTEMKWSGIEGMLG